jgi:hypothetical protein
MTSRQIGSARSGLCSAVKLIEIGRKGIYILPVEILGLDPREVGVMRFFGDLVQVGEEELLERKRSAGHG